MHTRNLTQKIEIDYVIKDKWHLPVHKHTYYELQYIIRGKGQHMINEQTYNYEKGDLFMLAPQENHFFIFQERTVLCVVKFHEGFFEDSIHDPSFKRLMTSLSSPNRNMLLSKNNKQKTGPLMELLIAEHRKETLYQDMIIRHTLALILALIGKDADQHTAAAKDDKIQSILNYIDQHITDKPLLSTQRIADTFNISRSYFSQYFSKATGSSYKKYIQEYALKLIAHQLIYKDKTLYELADEFGYSDESHLSNAFKAHFHQSPSAFKKDKQQH